MVASIGVIKLARGYNVVTSKNGEEYNLSDVNSDGLPDKVWRKWQDYYGGA
ncbi:hypothetical protein [Prevotella pallens]|uniref:hypothetical protein n=1 Tax=Prevotella pallens TaxID=60133 RepID=UPI001FE902C2|nr:hypothetical protein [Prevotella pallens]